MNQAIQTDTRPRFSLADRESLPEHLVLGPHAVTMIEVAEDRRRRLAAEWLPVSLSTDFEGAQMPDSVGELISREGAKP